jgi:SAM-dependent methyltransferase
MKQIPSFKYYAGKLVRHVTAKGFRSSAALVGKNLMWPYCAWLVRRRIREHEQFDLKHGLDTQTPILIRHLETSAPAAQYANPYEGAAIPLVHRILRQLGTDLSPFTFIDLGSGKGRVLLIAAQYPFKSVVGVEFSGTLHQTAEINISKFVEQGLTKTPPISINIDAGGFDFSQFGDKVVFCNNPFTAKLALQVIDNLKLAADGTGDNVILIYLTPIPAAVKDRLDSFQLIGQGRYLSHFGGFQRYYIYRIQSKASPSVSMICTHSGSRN